MKRCCCGNPLPAKVSGFLTTVSPCRCTIPGKGKSVLRRVEAVPDGITKQHYDERKAAGAPMMTDGERAAFVDKTWV